MTRQDDDRARRLAVALRENLKRRKAQARESAAGTVNESSRPFDAACGGAQDKLQPGPRSTQCED